MSMRRSQSIEMLSMRRCAEERSQPDVVDQTVII